METLIQDLRFGLRQLRRNRGPDYCLEIRIGPGAYYASGFRCTPLGSAPWTGDAKVLFSWKKKNAGPATGLVNERG